MCVCEREREERERERERERENLLEVAASFKQALGHLDWLRVAPQVQSSSWDLFTVWS